jgi:colicin import membrane protein
MSAAAIFEERIDPGRASSALLALAVHLILVALLVFGVSWQNRPPVTVTAELWEAPSAPPPPAPKPVVEPPKPVPRVETPPPPRPEPRIEKPDIVEKAPPKIKPAPKPEPKPAPLKPRVDETQKRIQQELAREQHAIAIDRERQQIRDQLAKESSAATSKALATWIGKIQTHIRNRINKDVADAVPGNPASVFVVTLLPTCEVLKITLIKSGGNKAYDDEVERAILKASPLPRPDKTEVFERELRLTFRPKDPI